MQNTKQLTIILLCALTFSSFAQEKKLITFHDTEGIPIEDVLVFHNSTVKAISNNNGMVLLDRNITRITCHRLGYKDTLIYLKNLSKQIVQLTPHTKIKDVVVSNKYNQQKHLIHLRNASHILYKEKTDTTIYYNFRIQLEDIKTGKLEYLEGLIRVLTKVRVKWPYVFICKIENFQFAPKASENSLFKWCDIENLLKENILMKRNYRWKNINNKQFTFERDWSIEDRIVFHISTKNERFTEIVFSGDTLQSFEFYFNLDKPISIPKTTLNAKQTGHFLLNWNTYIEYSQFSCLYPSFFRRVARYQTSEGNEVVCKIVLSESDVCTCNYDSVDNRYWSMKTIREQVEFIEKQVHMQTQQRE